MKCQEKLLEIGAIVAYDFEEDDQTDLPMMIHHLKDIIDDVKDVLEKD